MAYLSVTFSTTGSSTSRTIVAKLWNGSAQVTGRLMWECWATSVAHKRPMTAANTTIGNGTGTQSWFAYNATKFQQFRGSTDGSVTLALVCTLGGATRYVGVFTHGVYSMTSAISF